MSGLVAPLRFISIGNPNPKAKRKENKDCRRQATKLDRDHTPAVQVSYMSDQLTNETVSSGTVLVSATALLGRLPDNQREVQLQIDLGTHATPAVNATFDASVVLTIALKPGTKRDDDDGNDDAISDDVYDNT